MDNETLLKDQTLSRENRGNDIDIIESINQRIDDIQALLNEKQEGGENDQRKIASWTDEVIKIINTIDSEEKILRDLEEVYLKIQGKGGNRSADEQKTESIKIPIHPKTKETAIDIIHASERGIPMIISNNLKNTAGNLGIMIKEKDTPEEIIEKMKERLKKGARRENPPEEINRADEIKKQIDKILLPQQTETKKEEANNTPLKGERVGTTTPFTRTRTVSDLVLANLG